MAGAPGKRYSYIMRVLMFSIDGSLMQPDSEASGRMREYGALFDELHIIVYTPPGFSRTTIGANIVLYPTNTSFRPFYFYGATRIACEIIRNNAAGARDMVITSQDAFTNIAAFVTRWRLGIPLQVQVHTDFMSAAFVRESLKNRLRYFLYAYSVKRADGIRVVSRRLKDALMARYRMPERKITVLPIFVDTECVRRAPIMTDLHKKYSEYDFIILMASRVTKEKNIGSACRAVRDIAEKFPRTLLLIIGDGPEKAGLVRAHGASDEARKEFQFAEFDQKQVAPPPIRFEPAVSREELISYYKTADLFLLTSNYEGYGRTLVEAHAAGVPICATDVGVAREVIQDGETGRIVPVGDEGAVKAALLSVLLERQTLALMRIKISDALKTAVFPTKEEYLATFKDGITKCGRY
ncbi:MAG: hypothetical protein A3I44_05955 [Candidatus Sungbacteria bacterium RIFCSPLOWO2_02_FULL_51_17]|nr:MAG: hypothetical protein A2676_01480 [Candidatus Sungbacteria bacterium RIFCSPHIGHO2_01_FULL_51_22]OHA06921.1 MAG: hypothetical protein A3B29_04860 [Candidatus Sungbacteria bacterium RIFCSPLOWO2_01_FULL_51_34]OHA12393.1 MAG: hypothetical protein A3I44_05955 [Candidatus Sungbacteria bacterium RIFCSPLOWO2_02_FULL_51_17]